MPMSDILFSGYSMNTTLTTQQGDGVDLPAELASELAQNIEDIAKCPLPAGAVQVLDLLWVRLGL
jgi:hypothetical protein